MKIKETAEHIRYVMNNVLRKDEWEEISKEDAQSVVGVACMLAYLDGCKPDIKSMSKFLQIEQDILKAPFDRLLISGVFSKRFNARNDKCLKRQDKAPLSKCAWGIIAGISSGVIHRSH